MQTKVKGSVYKLMHFGSSIYGRAIRFVEIGKKVEDNNETYIKEQGTTNHELIDVLIDRINFLNNSDASKEAIEHLQKVKLLTNKNQ